MNILSNYLMIKMSKIIIWEWKIENYNEEVNEFTSEEFNLYNNNWKISLCKKIRNQNIYYELSLINLNVKNNENVIFVNYGPDTIIFSKNNSKQTVNNGIEKLYLEKKNFLQLKKIVIGVYIKKCIGLNNKDTEKVLLLDYIINNDLEAIKKIDNLDKMANVVNFKFIAYKNWTALHIAAKYNNIKIMRYLVEECHANINEEDDDMNLPLHIASAYGSYNVVQYLVNETNSKINWKNKNGWTPLHIACFYIKSSQEDIDNESIDTYNENEKESQSTIKQNNDK
eukprot:jgi/Orpsp1_1/1174876/evm.model.c7180000051775.1